VASSSESKSIPIDANDGGIDTGDLNGGDGIELSEGADGGLDTALGGIGDGGGVGGNWAPDARNGVDSELVVEVPYPASD